MKMGDKIYTITRFTQSLALRDMRGTRGVTYDSYKFPEPTKEEKDALFNWRMKKYPNGPKRAPRKVPRKTASSTRKNIDASSEIIDLRTFKSVIDEQGNKHCINAMEDQLIGILPSREVWEKEMLDVDIDPYHTLVEGDYYRWFMIEERWIGFETYGFNRWIYKLNTKTRRIELIDSREFK